VTLLAPLLALASGAAALLYQIVWLRWFKLLFGTTAFAASATLCAFFLGLAFGSALFARRAGRSPTPLRDYAWVEILVGATALAVPFVVSLYEPLYAALYARLADDRGLFLLAKFALALAGMLPTTVLLGGTLPLLTAAAVGARGDLGREGGFLYATNTIGAALGTAAGALWFPEAIGLRASYGVALALSTSVGMTALLAAHRAGAPRAVADEVAARDVAPRPAARASRALLVVAAASGFGTIALEVLLFHALAQILQSSVYSVGAVLLVVLAALGAAAYTVAGSARLVSARGALRAALVAEALILLALPGFVHATTGGLGVYLPGSLENGLQLALLFGAPALFVGGLVFPLTFRLAAGGVAAGERLGGLLAANTAGAIAGSLAASFLLLERIGLWGAIALLGAGYAVAGIAAAGSWRAASAASAALAAGAALVLRAANPVSLPVVALRPGESLLAVREGPHGVVSVTQESDGNRWLKIDNYYGLSSSAASQRQQRWGHLSLIHHPSPKRALFVGSATGGTAASAVPHPVDEIVLVEIVPEVNELAARFFAETNRGVHADPRTRLVVEDGRNHLRAAPERYDVVVADLFVPWLPSASSLFSREHFQSVRAHLAPHGVFAQWLPLYQLGREELETIAATFLDVFPDATVWRGDFSAESPTLALVGTLDPPPPLPVLAGRASALSRLGVTDRWLVDPRGFAMLSLGPLAALGDTLAAAPRTTDDRPMVEFLAGRKDEDDRARFRAEIWPALAATLAAGAEARGAAAAAAGARAGNALTRANALAVRRDPASLARAAALLRGVVPADLLQPPDPTAGEFWPDLLRGAGSAAGAP
jgi:spermidine synthase